ncbi:hemerythrin domain-containing protein [Dactylosporangium sp. NBC_01737]|uniref:hemerythrin domain-containing protein n=1 Tax=Dactylosporangium sp. NBC_01737 TaxID=2975959 RepID=UPI002E154AA6|nr:hemerythrin domain-containing protein [Dactylosporangium sp. NBC_01737]
MASHDRDRAVALSLQLARAHQELRNRLRALKADLGRHPRPASGADGLVAHCLAFCAAITAHHQGEDAGMFAELLRLRPDLAPTVGKLVEDHEMIAWILARIAELADAPEAALDAISAELDGLTAIVESHFSFEERAISAALDGGTPDTGWSAMVFGFRSAPSPPR